MPTGYTEKILKGESFEDFALDTASAFSYVARSINENGDLHAALPDPQKVGGYYKDSLEKAKKELKSVVKMSFNTAAKKAQKDFKRQTDLYNKFIAEAAVANFKMTKMLQQAEAYVPPATQKHAAHKAYMIDQIKTTIDMDGKVDYWVEQLDKLKPLTAEEWKTQKIKELTKEVENKTVEINFLSQLRTAVKTQPKAG